MAGGGGSDYRSTLGGISGRGQSGPSCSTLIFEAGVMSPDPDVVAQVELGTVCDIVLQGTPPQLAVYVRSSGAVLGAITDHWADLTSCIGAGYAYEAVIVALSPVRVRVQPATQV